MSCCIRCAHSGTSGRESGQASVEAALLLPLVLGLVAFLIQPACLLYTRGIMDSAATECVRALATARSGADLKPYEQMLRRRLDAIPEVSVFRTSGFDDWKVEFAGVGTSEVSVSVRGRARPLPLLGVVAQVFGELDGEEVVLHAKVSEQTRPTWLDGSYADWVAIWS